jgi:hypothetical protein
LNEDTCSSFRNGFPNKLWQQSESEGVKPITIMSIARQGMIGGQPLGLIPTAFVPFLSFLAFLELPNDDDEERDISFEDKEYDSDDIDIKSVAVSLIG